MKHPQHVADALAAFETLLRSWAPRFDLVAPGDLSRIRERHIEDSLRALPVVRGLPPGPCMDVGSGAGLPGIPLAIASDRIWRLLEPRRKRAAFLEEVVRELALDRCEVVTSTAEDAATDPRLRGTHAGVTARALAPPDRAVELCRPLLAPAGTLILFVGKGAEIPSQAEEVEPGLITIRRDAY